VFSEINLGELKGALAAVEWMQFRKSSICEQAITHGLWRRRRIVGDGHAI
jgi:hypothetical protein